VAVRREEHEPLLRIKSAEFGLLAWEFLATVIPDNRRERAVPFEFVKKTMKSQVAAGK
jgi:hypothetical protein